MQPIKGNSKVVSIRRETVQLDHQTGEVTKEASTNVFRLPAEPPYVKLYAHDLTQILKLKDHHAVMILELVRKIDYDNLISLTPSARSRIAEKLGVKDQTFRNYLNELVKADVIRRLGHNEFEANPTLFARGDWAAIYERQRAFTMTVSYTQKGRTVQTEISKEDNSAEA
ncbi:hypothetical protein D3C75_808200 [compost metagenome]